MLSPGFESDLLVNRLRSQLAETAEYWRVSTPENPEYFFGNFLIWKTPLSPDTLPAALDAFAQEFSATHRAFGWALNADAPVDSQALSEMGFHCDTLQILGCESLPAPWPLPEDVEFRPLDSGADWDQFRALRLADGAPAIPPAELAVFEQGQQACKQQLVAAGLGCWFGLFRSDELLTVAGLVYDQGLARFQDVITAPEHRRQGLCRNLLTHIGQWGTQHQGVNRFQITADEHYYAIELYRGLGFRTLAREVELWCPQWPVLA